MSNWWDAAPLADAAPQGAGNWWDAAPLAPDSPRMGSDMAAGMRAQREVAPMGAAEAAIRGIPKGFMAGLSDEASAAAAASPLPGAGAMRTSGAPNFGPLDAIAGMARMGAEKIAPSVFGRPGGDIYDRTLEQERSQDKRAMADQPVASIAGNIAGGLANPVMAALPAKGFLPGMAGGAVAGGAYGLGEGEGLADRAYKGAVGAGVGALVGGPLGGLVGRSGRSGGSAPPPNAVAEAGERLGVSVPRFVASESTPVQRLAQVERNIPFAGDRLVRSMDDLKTDMTGAADDMAAQMGATGAREAGERASAEIQRYMGPKLAAVSDRNYKAVDDLIAPNAGMAHPLNETQAVVANILARRQASGTSNSGAAVDAVREAIMRPGGLTYEGLKDLRSRFGTRVSDDLTQDVIEREFKAIYSGLTKDLQASVKSAGGQKAFEAWNKANAVHRMAMDRRAGLEKIVGVSGDNTGERVFERLTAMAGSTSRADLQTLMQAKKAMGPDAWNEFSGTFVQRLGRDANGEWTPNRFMTAWGKLSEPGKAALFGGSGAHRQALEDISTISRTIADRYAKFGNPSGTAQNVIGGTALTGGLGWAGIDPITTVATLVGNRAIAGILATPATASSMARWSRAYDALVKKPVAGSLAAFQTASRNFASTLGDKLGLNVSPIDFLRVMQSHAPARADEENK